MVIFPSKFVFLLSMKFKKSAKVGGLKLALKDIKNMNDSQILQLVEVEGKRSVADIERPSTKNSWAEMVNDDENSPSSRA